uniref:SXP/RAL-2 family protein Ani s 5-like cation-binding domain-containing protein n=1 Tax=Panagrolaimus sp. ES5 TaxID=591445 RepID=A0AC34F8Z5_9BILA
MIFRVAAMSGHQQHQRHSHGHGHGHHGIPPPMRDLENELNEEQKQEFKAIFQDDSLSKEQRRQKVKEFFEKIGGDTLTKYNNAKEKMEAHRAEKRAKFEEKLKGLSDEAKKHFAKVKEIKNDSHLNRTQTHEKIKQLFDGLPEKVKEEVKSVKPSHCGGPCSPGHDHGKHQH